MLQPIFFIFMLRGLGEESPMDTVTAPALMLMCVSVQSKLCFTAHLGWSDFPPRVSIVCPPTHVPCPSNFMYRIGSK